MFERFAAEKARYEKGQVFPFLIVIIVVMVILAMMTVNLGQIGVFRTDVSNAADAGALAGASVLSGVLLGLGLVSDSLCGGSLIDAFWINYYAWAKPKGDDVAALLSIWPPNLINNGWEIKKAEEATRMGWSNARMTALQYAFQNVGVTEPGLTLKQFLEHPDIRRIYNLPSRYEQIPLNEIPRYSEIYARADDPSLGPRNDPDRIKIGEVSRTGFSNYMREKHYWPRQYLNIRPLQPSPQDPVTAGYGWSIVNDRINNTYRVLNSYRPYPERDEPYQNYENWVEVQVSSKGKEYSVTSLSFGEKFGWSMALIALNIGIAMGIKWEEFLSIPVVGWLIWIGVTAFFTGLFTGAIASLIVGIKFDGDVDELTEGSPISVRVTRHKRDASYGIWNFRYGNLTAVADACTYRESKDPAQGTTIEPVFDFDLIGIISGRYGTRPFSGWFKTSRHLFETRLNYTE